MTVLSTFLIVILILIIIEIIGFHENHKLFLVKQLGLAQKRQILNRVTY
jgi:hypothetical protein